MNLYDYNFVRYQKSYSEFDSKTRCTLYCIIYSLPSLRRYSFHLARSVFGCTVYTIIYLYIKQWRILIKTGAPRLTWNLALSAARESCSTKNGWCAQSTTAKAPFKIPLNYTTWKCIYIFTMTANYKLPLRTCILLLLLCFVRYTFYKIY